MIIRANDREITLDKPTPVKDCLEALGAFDRYTLAALAGGTVLELNDSVTEDCLLTPLTLSHEEGRRIYERSLRFVMLLALRELWPGQEVRIEYSVGYGVFVRLPFLELHRQDIVRVENAMRRIIEADLPFEKKRWAKEDAITWFREDGQQDKVALLERRPVSWFNMYGCGGMWDYFYGAMAPSTGAVSVFTLFELRGGFVLQLPNGSDFDKAAPYVYRPRHLSVFSQSALWCEYLGIQNAADLSLMQEEKKLRNFIRVNEALHEAAIADIARRIAEKNKHIILIAGPSSSGKTTFAGRLGVHLQAHGLLARRISMDDYYIDRELVPVLPDGSRDYETLDIVDLPFLQEQVGALLDGESVSMPSYDFVSGKRVFATPPVTPRPGEVLIIEGIHALNRKVVDGFPADEIFKVFVSALTCLNLDDHNRIRTTDVRLLRRIVRDSRTRGTIPESTVAGWPSVRAGEEKWIFPWQEEADAMFNTTLHYELPVLKHFAFDLLKEIPESSPNYLPARRLIKMLNYMPDIDPAILSEIPPLSLLREFIGGCTLEEN